MTVTVKVMVEKTVMVTVMMVMGLAMTVTMEMTVMMEMTVTVIINLLSQYQRPIITFCSLLFFFSSLGSGSCNCAFASHYALYR